MKNFVRVLGLISLALAANACTRSIDNAELEKKIKEDGASKSWPIKSVSCPGNKPFKEGDKFDCTTTFEDGKTTTTAVEQKDGAGNLAWETKNLIPTKEIVDSISKIQGAAGITCPGKVVIAKEGDKFDCTGTLEGHATTWIVTIGKDGHFDAKPKEG